MERASNLSPNEQVIETVLALQVDPTESTSTDSSSEEKRPDCTMFGGYTVDTAKVEVPDITPAVSQEDYFPTEAPCSMKQREKQLSLAIVGCGSQEEVILNVRGLVSEFTKKEADLEELHQKEKHGVHRYCNNGVLAVYYVDKPPVIQLLRACDQSTQLDLFLCLEDTTETGTWNDSVNRSNNSKMTEQEQSDCAKDINQLQENQELEGVPGVVSDFCSNQVLMQRVGRRYRKNRRGTVSTTCIAMPQLSSEEIRMNVCNSFQAILLHRLRGANHLSINEDVVQAIATNIEKELFLLFFCTNTRYKNKYRSLMFNLKDPRNTHLFRQVLLGEITPQHLVLMSPTELASLELMKWRERENKHSIKLITTESEEFGRQPLIKLTHKGEIEIERDTDQNLTLEDLMGNSPKSTGSGELSDSDGNRDLDTTHRHRSHLLDFNCQICTGNQSISSQGRRTLSDHPMVVPTGSLRSLPQTTGNHSLLCDASTVAPPANRRLRRSEEPWMTSHLPDYTTYTSTNEITSCHFKYFSPIGSRAGSTTLANSPMRPKRFNSGAHAVWKGFIQTSNMKQFLVKAYPVLGHTNHLTKVLSTIIAVRKCVPSEPIWDSVDKLEPSKTKEICIVRFKPATVGDSVLYTSYYSYLNSRQRYGVVFLEQNSPQRLYLLPLPALQKLPSRLPPLSGPGLESSHPDLLLAMAFSKKQQPEDAFRKSHQHRRGPERCLRQNKPRQKYIEGIDKECPGDHSQLSPLSAKPGDQPHILPVLPAIPFMPQRELFHPSCQIQPSDLLLGDILSSEELLSCTDLSNITAAEILQSFCNDKQESDGMGNSNGPSAFTNDGLDANLGVNEGHHGVASRKGNEGRSMSEKVSSTQNLVAQFKPEDVLTENFLRSVTQLNSLLQQEDESVKENDVPVSEQESDWVASPQCEDTKTYLAELDKLFAKFPLSTLSQHEDCSHFHSTVSSCADVLNHLLSASNNSLDCEEQVPTYPDETPNNTPASSKGPQRVIQPGSPLSLTLQMPNNTQHLGHSGVMTAESGVLPHVLAASAVTMQQLEVSSQSRAENLFPFRFTSCNQRAKDSESHQPQEQRWSSLYCPTQSLHCTSLHKDNGQSRKAFSGAHPSYSDETT